MATHLDDEEDLEKLKTWWKENWIALVGGLVIGFGSIGGWEGYKHWRDGRSEAASQMYEDFKRKLAEDKRDEAAPLADRLAKDYASTPYAAAAALGLAQSAEKAGARDDASARLRWVVDESGDDGMAQLARLRLARVLLDQGQHQPALDALSGDAGTFESLYEELRGDIQFANGDHTAARSAYEKALAASEESAGTRPLLQQKIDDLAVAVNS